MKRLTTLQIFATSHREKQLFQQEKLPPAQVGVFMIDTNPILPQHQQITNPVSMIANEQRINIPEVDENLLNSPINLSPREHAIAQLVAQGLPNKVIAKQLQISPWTVASHLRRIFVKLGVTSRTAMIVKLLAQHLL